MKRFAASPVLRGGMWLLGLLLCLALVAASGWLAARREVALQVDSLGRAIEVNALALRGATSHYSYLPFTVSQHPKVLAALLSNDATPRHSANLYLEDINRRSGSEALYIMDAQGRTVAASNWNTPQSFVGQNYSNRPYVMDALDGRGGKFYGVGKTTGEPGYFLSTPVRQDGRIVGVVAVKVDLRRLQQTWLPAARLRWPTSVASSSSARYPTGSTPPHGR